MYIQQGENKATLHEDIIPADLKVQDIKKILKQKNKAPKSMGEFNGEKIFLKTGRFGPYIQAGKKMKSLLPGMTVEKVTEQVALSIISLPTNLGAHPETGEPILKDIGRYGPYVKSGQINGKIPKDINLLDITLKQAVKFLKSKSSGPTILKKLGKDKQNNKIEIKDGRYGAYVTNGKINATIPKEIKPNSINREQAIAMIKEKAAKGPTKKKFKKKK